MAFTRTVRVFHRRIAILLGIQLLLWTMSGVFFVWTDLDEIHGDHLRIEAPPLALGEDWISPSAVDFEGAGRARPAQLTDFGVVEILGEPHYRFEGTDGATILAHARTGELRDGLDEAEARTIAAASFAPDAPIESVTWLTAAEVGRHHEYRGQPLPAWVVAFDHPSDARVYVGAERGDVVRVRHRDWRIFDFLWMLHTMDYVGRDDFNNPWIRATALFAMIAVVSGYVLWTRTRRRAARS